MKPEYFRIALAFLAIVLSSCGGGVSNSPSGKSAKLLPCEADNNEQCMAITLSCTEPEVYGKAGWYHHSCKDEVIEIPNGRPVYAFLVNGFDQNHNLDMFHFYNFARCIYRRTEDHNKKAYVHFAWWNNLLAPYMKKPLHNDASVPGMELGVLDALPDYFGFLYDPNVEPDDAVFNVPTKAIPAEDYQFQKDAKAVLEAIRKHNPEAAIILAGHSMGGDAVIRLADSMPNVNIDLLAPIDPVGNRTCLPNRPLANPGQMAWHNTTCYGAHTFTRFRTTHTDWYYEPYRISYKDNNIGYLYHRWQNEALFPLDWECPLNDLGCPIWGSLNIAPYNYMFDWFDVWNIFRPIPADEVQLPDRYLVRHNDPRKLGINQGSTNIQSAVQTSFGSGFNATSDNMGGWMDGHGEIVGFRGALGSDSWPLALEARNWPRGGGCSNKKTDAECRIYHLKKWEADSGYLDRSHLAPLPPYKQPSYGYDYCEPGGGYREYKKEEALEGDYCTYCMVSGDLCEVLRTQVDIPVIPVNSAPVANAGSDQLVECRGSGRTLVTLDGSASSDPDEDLLGYTWTGSFGSLSGVIISAEFLPGIHTITLTVDDGRGKTDTDSVEVTVMDSTPPTLSISLSPNVLWPPNHKMVSITASIQITDACDNSPEVELVSIVSNEPDNGIGDGNTSDDIQGADFGTDDRAFSLRAERSGKVSGRIYTVTYRAIDDSNNAITVDTEVILPHDSDL